VLELVALLVAGLVAARRTPTLVQPRTPSFVLPAVDAPRPPRRIARGSVAQPATPMAEDMPRSRPVIRPSHARR